MVACVYQSATTATGIPPHSPFGTDAQVHVEDLVHLRDSCSFDLSPLGERYMLWVGCEALEEHRIEIQPTLGGLIKSVFVAGGVDLEAVVDAYCTVAYNWLPILDKEQLRLETYRALTQTGNCDDILAIVWLCTHIFMQEPCGHLHHAVDSALYRTARRLVFVLQTSTYSSDIGLLQAGILLTSYEIGHGLINEAHGTLAVCTALAQQLSLHPDSVHSHGMAAQSCKTQLQLCWGAIILLDRLL